MIDLHTHVLPALDDGPPDLSGSLEVARAAEAAGTRVLVATPHVNGEYQVTSEAVASGVRSLNAAICDAGVQVTVRPGAEVALWRALELPDDELVRLRLGGGSWLLVESPLSPAGGSPELLLRHVQARGHRIVLAHPERSPAFHRDPEMVRSLVDAGMLTSITGGALTGRFGATVRSFAFRLIEDGLVHNIASDAHDAIRRPPGTSDAVLAADRELPGFADHLQWLSQIVPAVILDGGEFPPPPPPPRRRRARSGWSFMGRG